MAMKNCFQVSTVSSTRAVVAPFASAEKIHLPTCKGFNISLSSSSPSFFAPSLRDGFRKPRFVCKAKEAVDAGLSNFCLSFPSIISISFSLIDKPLVRLSVKKLRIQFCVAVK